MQDKYVGDIGDFEKFLLLRNLAKANLRIGVNWCYNKAPEENERDGNKIEYLKDQPIATLDIELLNVLKEIVNSGNRNLKSIEEKLILPQGTKFFSKPIPSDRFEREIWFRESKHSLKDCDLVFVDPDNGLEIKTISKYHPRAVKYIFYDEIHRLYESGKSVVIYQHYDRNGDSEKQINNRKKQIQTILALSSTKLIKVKKAHGRFYLIIQQEKHRKIICNSLK